MKANASDGKWGNFMVVAKYHFAVSTALAFCLYFIFSRHKSFPAAQDYLHGPINRSVSKRVMLCVAQLNSAHLGFFNLLRTRCSQSFLCFISARSTANDASNKACNLMLTDAEQIAARGARAQEQNWQTRHCTIRGKENRILWLKHNSNGRFN